MKIKPAWDWCDEKSQLSWNGSIKCVQDIQLDVLQNVLEAIQNHDSELDETRWSKSALESRNALREELEGVVKGEIQRIKAQ